MNNSNNFLFYFFCRLRDSPKTVYSVPKLIFFSSFGTL